MYGLRRNYIIWRDLRGVGKEKNLGAGKQKTQNLSLQWNPVGQSPLQQLSLTKWGHHSSHLLPIVVRVAIRGDHLN